jgi:ABC-2 type transport system ATP-binding protein
MMSPSSSNPVVTGFPGPYGAGKSTTTVRMILGLDTASSGSVLVNGEPSGGLTDPFSAVGALLDAKAVVGGRSAATISGGWHRDA